MGWCIKNSVYIKKWKTNNREKYLKNHAEYCLKRYHYMKVIKELYNIELSIFD